MKREEKRLCVTVDAVVATISRYAGREHQIYKREGASSFRCIISQIHLLKQRRILSQPKLLDSLEILRLRINSTS